MSRLPHLRGNHYTAIVFASLVTSGCAVPNGADTDGADTNGADIDSETAGASAHAGVMMQGFYWDVPGGGTWYDTMARKADELQNVAGGYGIDAIWFPPPSKAENGCFSMGYDPYDYYDLGEYDQKGCTETRFGSQRELRNAIAAFRARGIDAMADIVLNHRSGGRSEWNPFANTNTWTDFSGVASGRSAWNHGSFHPNAFEAFDPGSFGGFPDVNYNNSPAYGDVKEWLQWLRDPANAGFASWRFDYVKGVHPWVVKDMKAASGNPFSVGELWDANTATLDWWTNEASSSAFDFALYYTMKDIFNNTSGGGHLPNLIDPARSFAAKNPLRAVTFLANHDTDEIFTDKMLGYAFILTYQGYPMIFWKDYFDYGLRDLGGQWGNGIRQLVWVRGKLADGAPEIELLKTDDGDQLIYGAKGTSPTTPGYIVVLNDNPDRWLSSRVRTGNPHLKGRRLTAFAWYSPKPGQNVQPEHRTVDDAGWVEVAAPPRGYAVYTIDQP